MLDSLDSPIARELLDSTIPARLAFVGPSGAPHVAPIWFVWNGQAFIMSSIAGSAKHIALENEPRIELTIDSDTPPYRALRARGVANLQVVDGVVAEYVEAAHRYYGQATGDRWIRMMRGFTDSMVRIELVPEWVEVADFAERFPDLF